MQQLVDEHACAQHGWKRESHEEQSCVDLNEQWEAGREETIRYIAAQAIPQPFVSPRGSHCRQLVFGTVSYLLPYMILSDQYVVLAMKPQDWSEKRNALMVFCAAMQHWQQNKVCRNVPIRLVTKPGLPQSSSGALSITGKEVCALKHQYGMRIWKAVGSENLYFILPAHQRLSTVRARLVRAGSKGECFVQLGGHRQRLSLCL
jgi:hypothetical protein